MDVEIEISPSLIISGKVSGDEKNSEIHWPSFSVKMWALGCEFDLTKDAIFHKAFMDLVEMHLTNKHWVMAQQALHNGEPEQLEDR